LICASILALMSRGAVEVMFPPFEDKKLRFFLRQK